MSTGVSYNKRLCSGSQFVCLIKTFYVLQQPRRNLRVATNGANATCGLLFWTHWTYMAVRLETFSPKMCFWRHLRQEKSCVSPDVTNLQKVTFKKFLKILLFLLKIMKTNHIYHLLELKKAIRNLLPRVNNNKNGLSVVFFAFCNATFAMCDLMRWKTEV